MNRSQKFLGITLMASLLCGFTPMQSEAKEYKIGGMYTYDYHDGRHADWGEYELHAAKMAIEDINAARVGMLAPEIVERDTGIAEVRDVFRVPKVGNIAGCYITEGEISRDDKVRVVRDSTVIFEGKISSLRRFKDDVKTVKQSYECGIGVEGYQDIKVGDVIEGFRIEEVERTE